MHNYHIKIIAHCIKSCINFSNGTFFGKVKYKFSKICNRVALKRKLFWRCVTSSWPQGGNVLLLWLAITRKYRKRRATISPLFLCTFPLSPQDQQQVKWLYIEFKRQWLSRSGSSKKGTFGEIWQLQPHVDHWTGRYNPKEIHKALWALGARTNASRNPVIYMQSFPSVQCPFCFHSHFVFGLRH